MALHVNAWEMRHLRLVFKMKPTQADLQQEDGYANYLRRTARMLERFKEYYKRPSLVHVMLKCYFKEA